MFDLGLLLKGLAVGISLLAGIASYKYFNQPEDNAIEEVSEEFMYKLTGLDVDLSPYSPEKK